MLWCWLLMILCGNVWRLLYCRQCPLYSGRLCCSQSSKHGLDCTLIPKQEEWHLLIMNKTPRWTRSQDVLEWVNRQHLDQRTSPALCATYEPIESLRVSGRMRSPLWLVSGATAWIFAAQSLQNEWPVLEGVAFLVSGRGGGISGLVRERR